MLHNQLILNPEPPSANLETGTKRVMRRSQPVLEWINFENRSTRRSTLLSGIVRARSCISKRQCTASRSGDDASNPLTQLTSTAVISQHGGNLVLLPVPVGSLWGQHKDFGSIDSMKRTGICIRSHKSDNTLCG